MKMVFIMNWNIRTRRFLWNHDTQILKTRRIYL